MDKAGTGTMTDWFRLWSVGNGSGPVLGLLLLLVYGLPGMISECWGGPVRLEYQLVRVKGPEQLVLTKYRRDRYPLFSSSYRNWGTLKTGGKQVQFGKLVPALGVVDGRVVVAEHPSEARRWYRRATFWLAAGPVLVRRGEPVRFGEIHHQYPHLNIDGRTARVVLLVWPDHTIGFLFHPSCSLREMQQVAVRLKATTALNLDGGSCTVWQTIPPRCWIGRDIMEGRSWCIGLRAPSPRPAPVSIWYQEKTH